METLAEAVVPLRPYAPADRARVRGICAAAAFHDAAPGRALTDRELLADILTLYYTDEEPETAVVAGPAGAAVGYVIGTLSTRRFVRRSAAILAGRVLPRFLAGRYRTGRELPPLLAAGALDAALERRPPFERAYPAHFHIALDPAVRSRGLGRRLLALWMERAAARGARGIHCSTQSSNERACAFFEAMGFSPLCRNRSRFWTAACGRPIETVIYGRTP